MTFTFFVEGQPLPKERPRIGKNRAYTPPKTQAWENTIAWGVRAKMGHLEPFMGDVKVTLVFHRKGKKRADLDNFCKSALDAMNGIVYHDDKQVTRLEAIVIYGSPEPGVSIKVDSI